MSEKDYKVLLEDYRLRILQLVGTLAPNVWREIHGSLRLDAAWMDKNHDLYLLLRLAPWEERKDLEGKIAGALWIRHIAEVIRRPFEEVFDEEWLEEGRAFETWFAGARKRTFGSERPLNHTLRSRPYIAYKFGLFTGSAVRWYVEGETEYFAIREILDEPSVLGVELVNLHGNVASERDNAALKPEAWLKEDRALRRFSVVSFDRDLPANVRAIRRQVEQDNVVGSIGANNPDFEFHNFAVAELAEVAARIDESSGFSGDVVRNTNWSGIASASKFEKRYCAVSARNASALKGQHWGRALGRYAAEHPTRSDSGHERAILGEIRAAFHARMSSYDFQREYFTFDPASFALVKRQPSVATTGAVPQGH